MDLLCVRAFTIVECEVPWLYAQRSAAERWVIRQCCAEMLQQRRLRRWSGHNRDTGLELSTIQCLSGGIELYALKMSEMLRQYIPPAGQLPAPQGVSHQ